MMHYWQNFGGQWGGMPLTWFAGAGFFFFILLIAWSLIWKGLALWKAARLGSRGWFVALLIINTVGIFEILYLYVFSKKGKSVEGPEDTM